MAVENDSITLRIFKTPSYQNIAGHTYINKSNLFSHRIYLNSKTGAKLERQRNKSKTSLNFKIPVLGYTPNDYKKFLKGSYTERSFRKMRFNAAIPMIIKENNEVKKYLRSLTPRGVINVRGIDAKEGVWLIESDNKKYYKILFFKKDT
ncbi:hypothetical protein [Hyunsoonleella ulvae]|uniref:hypothetical protein n=1 Tax=Hyunsoonleella ulvae TaxID=2799948 RepID=UPI001939963B|nr:hypothetical protein [Hyunsoonleella ulvae]